jgi:hypothetical protein
VGVSRNLAELPLLLGQPQGPERKGPPTLLARLKTRLAILMNRYRRRRGPAIQDQCAKVIMNMCAIQLDRGETRELAPVKPAVGAMVLSGGAITTVVYRVFDRNADKVDKTIRQEPWRAFTEVTMRITVERDPEFEVKTDGKETEPKELHKAPGIALIKHLSEYFPLLPKAHTGPVFIPADFAPPQAGGVA